MLQYLTRWEGYQQNTSQCLGENVISKRPTSMQPKYYQQAYHIWKSISFDFPGIFLNIYEMFNQMLSHLVFPVNNLT